MARLYVSLGLLAVAQALPDFLALPQVTPYIPTNDTFGDSFLGSFLSTLVIEARDKTFVLTALLAATKMRKAVAMGAITSAAFLTIVCSLIGYIFVPLIEEGWVNWAAVIAYLAFCWWFTRDWWYFTPKDVPDSLKAQEGIASEPQPTQEPLREPLLAPDQKPVEHYPPPSTQQPLEPNPDDDSPSARRRRWLDLYLKSAILLFLGEWSDATMVSTSELAQKNTFWGVFVGCMTAYLITTTVAVFAGRWLGSKMKYRHMLLLTAFIFLIFALFTVFY